MKLAISFALILAALTTVNANAASAAYWDCRSDKAGLTAEYSVSMFGETLETIQAVKGQADQKVIYIRDFSAQLPEGEELMFENDETAPEMTPKAGSIPHSKADIQLEGHELIYYDLGFLFQGNLFVCKRR
jgi:hypothetical protein